MPYLKNDVRQENGALSLKSGNNRGVANDVMFAYVHEKINILLSVLSIYVLLNDFNLNIQGFIYLEFLLIINWASLETCKFSRNAV